MARAQGVTGQISGSVTDPAGAVIAGAAVQLVNDLTKQQRAFITLSNGSFIFPDLVPGNYSVQIKHSGFKTYDQRGINVSPNEKVALHGDGAIPRAGFQQPRACDRAARGVRLRRAG
jgi:hypothetical protein